VTNHSAAPCEYRTVTEIGACLARIDELEPKLRAFQAVRPAADDPFGARMRSWFAD
jgi:hypothetical protein